MGDAFVYTAFFAALLLFFPVFLYVDGYCDAGKNKLWFSVALYRGVRLFGGYARCLTRGIEVHLGARKAIRIAYGDLLETRKKFEITKGFQLWRLHQIVETGGSGSPVGALIAGGLQGAFCALFSVLKTRYPFVSCKNDLILTNEAKLNVTFEAAAVFNGLVLCIAAVKKLLEVGLKWIRKRRSTASSKRRRSS